MILMLPENTLDTEENTAEIELGNKACWAMFWLLVKGTIPS